MRWTLSLVAALLLTNILSLPAEAQRRTSPPQDEPNIEESRQMYRDLDRLEQWCDDVVGRLERAEYRAELHQAQGEFGLAVDDYTSGMQRALDLGKYVPGQVMTKKALIRGIRILSQLKREIGNTSKGLRTGIWYASDYYDFIRDVATNLDVPFVIPRLRCRDCHNSRLEEFEQKYIWFVGETIATGTDALSFARGEEMHPIGRPHALLLAMKSAATDAVSDLRDSLWSTYYACTIEELQEIADDIDTENPQERFELALYWYPLKDISKELLDNRGRCGGGHSDHYERAPRRGGRGPGGPGGPR
jgi:hypothetical protein